MRLFISQYPLEASAIISTADNKGDFPLHVCCQGGHQEVLSILAEGRPARDLDVLDAGGNSPFLRAVASGQVQVACQLIDLGANPRGKNKDSKDVIDLVPESLSADLKVRLYDKLLSSGIASLCYICIYPIS